MGFGIEKCIFTHVKQSLPTFKIKIMRTETQNYCISHKIIVPELLIHKLLADGDALFQIYI